MSVENQRYTVLRIINETRRKAKLNPVTTIDQDSDSLSKLSYLNDVISEISDYGNWQETLTEVLVTAQSSVYNYSISSAYVVQNIHEVVWSDDIAEMRKLDLDQIRRQQRAGSFGEPKQWCVAGTNTDGNPIFSVTPIPVSSQAGETFSVLFYQKQRFYVTADVSAVPPFPGALIVQGLLSKTVLDESDGEPTTRYQMVKSVYDEMLYESYNRYNGDSGSTVFFRPGRGRR